MLERVGRLVRPLGGCQSEIWEARADGLIGGEMCCQETWRFVQSRPDAEVVMVARTFAEP